MMGKRTPAQAGQQPVELPVPLKQWQEQINRHMPHLSKPARAVLCLWSLGIAALQCAGLTTVAVFAADLLGCKADAARQRLREFFREAAAKKGEKREALDVGACFLPMLRWVLSKLGAGQTRLGIALDATTLADRFTVLAVSVVYQGVAIPVGWTVLTATAKGAWKPHWLNLLERFRGAVPAGLEVFALTDRGLYAKWLFDAIKSMNWRPFMRVNTNGLYTRRNCRNWHPLSGLIGPGQLWRGKVVCFKGNPLECTLLARWEAGHKEPWLIVTDVEPEAAEAVWYSQRSWIEAGFKDMKRGGLQWQNTRMEDPERAARLWLAMSAATLLQIEAGVLAEARQAAESSPELPAAHISRVNAKGRKRRWLSVFRHGWIDRLVQMLRGKFHFEDGGFPVANLA